MDKVAHFRSMGLFDLSVPRYTSYPTAPKFTPAVTEALAADWIGQIEPGAEVSLYLHIPFCERLCWYCACRTQGTRTRAPVDLYLATLLTEARKVASLLHPGARITRMHWGGGTPTILVPDQIDVLTAGLRSAFGARLGACDLSVEIDPTCLDEARVEALMRAGLTRASIGIQDFAPEVQAAIGREQTPQVTRDAVNWLRRAGITGINGDLVYGLPHQTPERLARTLDLTLDLRLDRIALFGYAHVPWMARRQRMIPEDALPDPLARYALATLADARLTSAGYRAIGIDHYARPGDTLAIAAETGRLRRNFQGYTDDTCTALIGLGASAISRFAQGHAQNAPATSAYQARIRAGGLAVARGFSLSLEDRLRARAIEMLMCDFRIDLKALATQFGSFAEIIAPDCRALAARFADDVTLDASALTIAEGSHPLTRIIAAGLDAYAEGGGRHSRAV